MFSPKIKKKETRPHLPPDASARKHRKSNNTRLPQYEWSAQKHQVKDFRLSATVQGSIRHLCTDMGQSNEAHCYANSFCAPSDSSPDESCIQTTWKIMAYEKNEITRESAKLHGMTNNHRMIAIPFAISIQSIRSVCQKHTLSRLPHASSFYSIKYTAAEIWRLPPCLTPLSQLFRQDAYTLASFLEKCLSWSMVKR